MSDKIMHMKRGFGLMLFLALGGTTGCVPTPEPPRYDAYVWPRPPDKPRIRLEDVVFGRKDVLAKTGGIERKLLGATPMSRIDSFQKPIAVEFDSKGRLLVTDWEVGALFRLDRASRTADVFGLTGAVRLARPYGLGVGPDDTVYVSDMALRQVLAFDLQAGNVKAVYGKRGELENPTDAAVSPDGSRLFVADSKAHRIVVFDLTTGERVGGFGKAGAQPGEFAYPSSLCFDNEGQLLVVDQMNFRVQMLSEDGDPVDAFGSAGVGFGNFTRPKDVAVDEVGYIYVTDAAFGNIQIFDVDFQLLTFVGAVGSEPGQFTMASGIAVRGERFAVVDQLTPRVQVFRYLVPKGAP